MLRCVLGCFEVVSELHLNFEKTCLIAIGAVPNLDQLVADLGCQMGSLPLTYLGMPLRSLYKQKEVWVPIVDRMSKCLAGWKT